MPEKARFLIAETVIRVCGQSSFPGDAGFVRAVDELGIRIR